MIDKCKVFTPEKNAMELLDYVEYKEDLYGKKLIENACGDGRILEIVVERYIKDCLNNNKDLSNIKKGLEEDIYGAELDIVHHKNCIKNLNLIAEKYGITQVKWNILNEDILKKNWDIKFDYVVGNPPYIGYRDLPVEVRKELRKKYKSCTFGKFDYCYAFIEESLNCLNETGKLAYLIPNSIFKNVFAKELRQFLLPFINQIIDYTSEKLFKNALTSSAILICDKKNIRENLEYFDIVKDKKYLISKEILKNKDKWIFYGEKIEKSEGKRFGDYFHVAITIATLYNKAYVIDNFLEEENYINVGKYKIEKEVIKKGISPRGKSYNLNHLLIFPYYYKENKLMKYTEDEFEKKYPEATEYLKLFENELSKRAADSSTKWFEYGRTQALAHLNNEKLLISTVVTKKIFVYKLKKEEIPYSGIYIIPKKNISLDKAKEILESDEFLKYIDSIGINASGCSKRVTAKDISNFKF